jgi:hypothetical protein
MTIWDCRLPSADWIADCSNWDCRLRIGLPIVRLRQISSPQSAIETKSAVGNPINNYQSVNPNPQSPLGNQQ